MRPARNFFSRGAAYRDNWVMGMGKIATFLAATAVVAASVSARAAWADDWGYVGPGGCGGEAHVATPGDAAQQAASGQQPCYGAHGRPYYTQGSDPCY